MRALGIGVARYPSPEVSLAEPLDVTFAVLRAGDDPAIDAVLALLRRPVESAALRVDPKAATEALAPAEHEARRMAQLIGLPEKTTFGRTLAPLAVYEADLSRRPESPASAFLRLHLLSARLVRPHGLSLEGVIGGLLPTLAWTDAGPFTLDEFDGLRFAALADRVPALRVLDRLPRMVDYVLPPGVRIGVPARVRLGAYLSEGTVIMHEGFVNFNAGTLGSAMVEGRISAGVVVGDGTDIGGGASIMGTLAGGGKEVITVGQKCLLGANSGLGISLGDHCTIEAGLYVTAGTKVGLPDGRTVKALALSGQDGLLFRRNSQSGAVEVITKRNEITINPALLS